MSNNTANTISFTLILPCFNPPVNWEKIVVASVRSIAEKTGVMPELILVNDGSVRNMEPEKIAVIEQAVPDFRYIQYSHNRGKGYALRQGVSKATNDLIIYTDIDFPYLESSLIDIYEKLCSGYDVVPGRRGKEYYSKTPFLRKLISKFLRWTLKVFLRLPTDDSQCGIKGFNKKGAVVFLETKIDRFLFDLEFIKLASKRKLSFSLANAELKPDVIFSKVSFSILLRESVNFIKVLWR